MPREKASELFEWKNKVDNLEYLPGEPAMDRGNAWQKLYKRLDEKPRDNKIAWYWIAAAVVIALTFMLWLSPGSKQKNLIVTDKQEKPTSPLQAPETKGIVQEPIQPALGSLQEQQLSETKNRKQKFKAKKIETPAVTYVAISDSPRASKSEAVLTVPNPIETTSEVVAVPLKKRLKVVHINELQTSAGQRIEYAETLSPGFRATPANRDRLTTVFLSRNSSDDIVKIKLSPSN